MKYFLLFALLLVGCSVYPPDPKPTTGTPPVTRRTPLPPPRPVSIPASVGLSESRFACDLWRANRGKPENRLISPLSLSAGLSLLAEGAHGATARELRQSLGHPTDGRFLQQAMSSLAPTLTAGQRLYVRPDIKVRPDFLKLAQTQYATEVLPLTERGALDQWTNQLTQGRVPKLASSDEQSGPASLILINCLYLSAEWESPFKRANTAPLPFRSAGKTVTVDTMRQRNLLRYAIGPDFQVVELPYRGDRLVFDCLLPNQVDGLAALEDKLRWDTLGKVLSRLGTELVDVSLPRFRLQTTLDFKPALESLGIREAFMPVADFKGICEGLFITQVLQQTWLKLDEEGTEAMAATEILIAAGTPHEEPKSREFKVDHPFLFLIRDRSTGLILFIGRVVQPEAGAR